jgi:hypothetical protein
MHLAEVRIPTLHAFQQLSTEKAWLSGELPGSIFASHGNRRPAPLSIDIAKKIEKVLESCELAPVLRVLERHNNEQDNEKGRKRRPFLLAPYLFQAINSIEQRKTTLKRMPVLGRRPGETRTHFHEASAKARALARRVRKGPQPLIALAAHDDAREAVTLFQPFPIIQSPDRSETTVTLDWVLDRTADSLDSVAKKIASAGQHRKRAANANSHTQSELRRLAADLLVTAFRRELGYPYHSHVATIVTTLTGIDTDADYVKKIEKRKLRATAVRGQNS